MKTEIILHGGFTPGEAQVDDPFFEEILKEAPNMATVLLVYFAKEADRIPKNREEDIEQFNKNKGERSLQFVTATEEDFLNQVREADVVYLHGGQTGKILGILKKYPDLKSLFEGKIIAGDSAGANVLAAVFYSKSLGVTEGLGIVPIKLICHCEEGIKDKLEGVKPELETVLLPEYQFKVLMLDQ